VPDLGMGGDQMFGALGDRGLQRLVGGLGGAQRVLQFAARTPGGQRQYGREDQDQQDACEVNRQQDTSIGVGFGASGDEQPALFGDRLFEIADDRGHRRAVFPPDEISNAGLISGIPEPDHFAVEINLPHKMRFGFLDQALLVGVGLDGLDQAVEGGQDCAAGITILPGEFLIAGQREAARRAFHPAQLWPHIRQFREHDKGLIDGGVVGPGLEIQADRSSANDEEDRETDTKNDALRRHCRLLFHYFERRATAIGLVVH
jgi:hypothetical protein